LAGEGLDLNALKLARLDIGEDLDLSFSGPKDCVVRATERHPEISVSDVAASVSSSRSVSSCFRNFAKPWGATT